MSAKAGYLVIDAAGTYAYLPGLGPYDNMGGTDRTHGYITQVDLATGATRRVVTGSLDRRDAGETAADGLDVVVRVPASAPEHLGGQPLNPVDHVSGPS